MKEDKNDKKAKTHAELKQLQKKAQNMTPQEIDSEGHTKRDDCQNKSGNYQGEFEDDKEFLASDGGGRSFKHIDDENEA